MVRCWGVVRSPLSLPAYEVPDSSSLLRSMGACAGPPPSFVAMATHLEATVIAKGSTPRFWGLEGLNSMLACTKLLRASQVRAEGSSVESTSQFPNDA